MRKMREYGVSSISTYNSGFPLHEVGVLELNRNPENYFAEVVQAAFTPAHVVPGIGFLPDKFLQTLVQAILQE